MKTEIKNIAQFLKSMPKGHVPAQFTMMTKGYDPQSMPEVQLDPARVMIALSIITVRDKDGRNNGLVGGCMTEMSNDPETIMGAIGKARFSHHMAKENGSIVINMFNQGNMCEYQVFGSTSGRNTDKFASVIWQDGDEVNAPILLDCPANLECRVIAYGESVTHGFFYCKVEKIHVDEQYLDADENVLWDKINPIIG